MLGPTLVFASVVLTSRAFQTYGEIDILTSARVSRIDGKSVKIERPDGSAEEVEYGSLVLACSGFGGNPAMNTGILAIGDRPGLRPCLRELHEPLPPQALEPAFGKGRVHQHVG